MGQLKKLAGQTAIYGVSSIVGRLLNWLLTPFYTGIFEPAEFGRMTVLYGYSAFLLILFTYGLETAYFRFSTKQGNVNANTYGQVMALLLASTLIFAGVLWVFAGPVASFIQYSDHPEWIRWFAAIIAIDAITSVPFAKLRLSNRPIKFASIKLANILFTILLNVLFLVIAPMSVSGQGFEVLQPIISPWYNPHLGIGYIFVANFIASALVVPLLTKEFFAVRFTWDSKTVVRILKYSLPVALMGLAGIINETFGRVMIKYLLPEGFYGNFSADHAAGVFGACFKLSIFMNLGIQAFRYAAEPFFFSRSADSNSPELFSKVMKWFIIFGAIVFLAISLNLSWLGLVLRQAQYREALFIVPFLLMAYLFLGIYYNLSVWYKLTDKTYYGAYIGVVGAAVTIVGNIVFIPIWGYLGSAVVATSAYFLMAVASYMLGEKHYPIPYRVQNAVLYILSSSGIAWVLLSISFPSLAVELMVSNLVLLVFVALIVYNERKDLPLPKRFIS